MTRDLSPRAAALLFARALRRVDRIDPAALREPVAMMLEAGIELCASSRSLLGKRANDLIAMAEALTADEGVTDD